VLADGYYEWREEGASRRPYLIRAADGAAFGMAALWETWRDPADGSVLQSCAIVTREAVGPVRDLHQRMSVILAADARECWLDPERTEPGQLAPLLAAPGIELAFHPVSRRVNNPRQDDPELLLPASGE
jgi:putative SOS response-associated peptidase YedK